MFSRFKIFAILGGIALVSPVYSQPQFTERLSFGLWYKFSVTAEGMYKIDYSMLEKAGFHPDKIDPKNLQLFAAGNGMSPQTNDNPRLNALKETAIFVQGESDGKFDKGDFILFWGDGPDTYSFDKTKQLFNYQKNLYSDKNFYFLTVASAPGIRISQAENLGAGFPVVDTYDAFNYYENDKYNILKSGREWFGEQFDSQTEVTIRFGIEGVVPGSPIRLVTGTMAQSYQGASSFNVFFNGKKVTELKMDPIPLTQYGVKGSEALDTIMFNADEVNAPGRTSHDVKYQYVKADTGISIGYLNYIQLSMKCQLAHRGVQTIFTSAQSLENPVSGFVINTLPQAAIIWDVTDIFQSKNQLYSASATAASFAVTTDALRKFVSFTIDKVPAPIAESVVENQDLYFLPPADLLIVTHPDFKNEADRLADYRRTHNQLAVNVVTVQQIYNAYSGGKQDPTAIRDFVRDCYSQPGATLDNLLLFGRCSYDYKNRTLNNTNFVPTYESRNSLEPLETFSSDDYFALLEPGDGEWVESPAQNSTMEIGVGRISVTTSADAHAVIDKLIEYDSPGHGGSWRQNIVFVADDGDYNIHQSQADQLAKSIDNAHPDFVTDKIYLDAFKQIVIQTRQFSPKAKDALDRAVEDGATIVNFTGHGSEEVWMQEQVLDGELIKQWKNGPKYPLFVTATCEFGRHDDPFQISNGERLLLRKGGGAISLVTTARPVNSSTNFELNKAFYDALFLKENGQFRNLGSIFRDTKNNSISGISNRNFSLIGDPSLQLAMPENDIAVTSLKTAFNSDTLKALSSVTLQGEVRQAGIKRSDFQGEVDVTLFDRPVSFTTLGDENPPFIYNQWSNLLFRGKASVHSGDFTISFIIPNHLDPDFAKSKVTLYATNGTENASGSSMVVVGGEETDFPPDQTPPEIHLFIGDTTFINGGVASPTTNLVVQLRDASGIAIYGADEANSLVAILDDSLTYLLNDYYTAALNDYTKGTVHFSLKDLPKGKHHVVVEASDTHSNRGSVAVDFVVTEDGIIISQFYNYPNPFSSLTESTILGFTHNRPGDDLEADLSIYDLAGHLIDFRHYSVENSYSNVTLAEWDGANTDGNKLTNGIYLGKLMVRSLLDGSKNEHITKLIIVN